MRAEMAGLGWAHALWQFFVCKLNEGAPPACPLSDHDGPPPLPLGLLSAKELGNVDDLDLDGGGGVDVLTVVLGGGRRRLPSALSVDLLRSNRAFMC